MSKYFDISEPIFVDSSNYPLISFEIYRQKNTSSFSKLFGEGSFSSKQRLESEIGLATGNMTSLRMKTRSGARVFNLKIKIKKLARDFSVNFLPNNYGLANPSSPFGLPDIAW